MIAAPTTHGPTAPRATFSGPMRILLVGTGTDVGKTHVACALLAALRTRGATARGYKPVATGIAPGAPCEDASLHARASGAPYEPPTYAFEPPVSPHLAARAAGRAIEIDRLAARADAIERELPGCVLVIETAGGLFTPLAPGATNAELARRLAPARVILVAPDRLGVLHDVGATSRAAKALALGLEVVLSAPAAPDPSTGTNAAELANVGLAAPLTTFPRAAWDAPESLAAAAAVLGVAPSPAG